MVLLSWGIRRTWRDIPDQSVSESSRSRHAGSEQRMDGRTGSRLDSHGAREEASRWMNERGRPMWEENTR